jgi:hypothetical protein
MQPSAAGKETGITCTDVLEIHSVLSLYGHVLDSEAWSELADVFTQDARVDTSALDGNIMDGLDALQQAWSAASHAKAHHVTNVVIVAQTADAVMVRSKGLGIHGPSDVRSLVYEDTFVRTSSGWRIQSRRATGA